MQFVDILVPFLIIVLLVVVIILSLPASFLPDDLVSKDESGDIGVNVTTGQVKVDITDTEGNSIVGDVLKFSVESDGDEVRFHPGVTFYTEGFQIRNTGDIKITYRMFISLDEGVDNEKFEEAFEFYITTAPKDLDNAEKILSFDGALDAALSSETYYLVVKMKDTAGNEFQNKTFTGIGITVNATQATEG